MPKLSCCLGIGGYWRMQQRIKYLEQWDADEEDFSTEGRVQLIGLQATYLTSKSRPSEKTLTT